MNNTIEKQNKSSQIKLQNILILFIIITIFILFIYSNFNFSFLSLSQQLQTNSLSQSQIPNIGNLSIKTLGEAWQLTHSSGEESQLTFWTADAKEKKTELGWIPFDNSCTGWVDKYLTYKNGTRILDDKDKDILLKCESSKCDGQNCYHISLTDAQAINIDEEIKLGDTSSIVEYQNINLLEYVSWFNANITLFKNINGDWNNNVNDIFVFHYEDSEKFGANDSSNNNISQYKYNVLSNQEIIPKGNKPYIRRFIRTNSIPRQRIEEMHVFDFSDICNKNNISGTEQNAECNFEYYNSFNNITNLTTYYLNVTFYSNSSIDPSITIDEFTTSESIDTNITQENNFTHLTISDSAPYDDLVFYMSFDDNQSVTITYDYSENNNDGTFYNEALYFEDGFIGGAIDLDGVNDYVDIVNLDGTLTNSDNITFSYWYQNDDTTNSVATRSFFDDEVNSNLDSFWDADEKINCKMDTADDAANTVLSNDAITDANWHFIVCRYNSTTLSMFVDNVEQTDSDTQTGNLDTISNMRIGEDFDGRIDEFMLFNNSLTDSQISDIYNNQSSRFKTPGTQELKQFNATFEQGWFKWTEDDEQLFGSDLQKRVGEWEVDDGYKDGDMAYDTIPPVGVNLLNNSYGSFEGVSATSTHSSYYVAELVDNENERKSYGWLGGSGVTKVNVTFNLTNSYEFNTIEIFRGATSYSNQTNVWVSDDAISWTKIANEVDLQSTTTYLTTINLTTQNKRYIKLELLDKVGTYQGMGEVRVFKNTTNLANLTTTSVSTSTGGTLANSRDNDFSTYTTFTSSVANFNLTYNFSSSKNINYAEAWLDYGGQQKCSVWISNDGSNYTKVDDVELDYWRASNAGTLFVINFAQQNTQWLKLEFYDFTDPTYRYFQEVRIFESELRGGLVGYWRFDNITGFENDTHVHDWSKNGNDGTVVGGTDVDSGNIVNGGVYSGGQMFDGDGDYVDVDVVANDMKDTGTVLLWINHKKFALDSYFFAGREGADERLYLYSDASGNFYIRFADMGSAIDTGYNFVLNEWTFVAINWSNTNITTWINGIENSNHSSTTSLDQLDVVNIGGYNDFSLYFNGSIDEVMIFNRSLSSSEIKELYIKGRAKWDYQSYQDADVEYIAVDPDTTNFIPEYNFIAGNTTNPFYSPILKTSSASPINLTNDTGVDDPPTVTLVSPADDNQTYSNITVEFNCSATDDLMLSNFTWYVWNSSGGQINMTSIALNGTFNTTLFYHNFTYDNLTEWNCYVCDNATSTQCAWATNNFTLNITTTAVVDIEYPIFNDTEEFPVDPTTWASGKTYHFNMTINNTNSTGGIEFNNTNYSVKNATATKYNFTINDIPAGVYTYNWWAYGNGTDNNFNFSEDYTYTINQLNSSVNLTLNNQNQNITINVSNTVNLTCEIYSGQGSMNLYNNSIQINDGLTTDTLSNVTNYSTAGVYNVTCIALESQNYSQNYSTFWVNVTTPPTASTIDLVIITPEDLTKLQNATQYEYFNITVNVTCRGSDCGEVNVSFDPWINQSDGFNSYIGFGAGSVNGITSKSDGLWFLGTIDGFIYHSNFNGVNQSDGIRMIGTFNAEGITSNGSDFWVIDNTDDFVYHYNSTGQNQSDGFSTPPIGITSSKGIATNGSSLWIVDNLDDFVYHTDYSGNNLTGGFSISAIGIGEANGFEISNNEFWIIDYTDGFVYHINSTLQNQTDGFDTNQFGIGDGRGITRYNNEFWIADQSDTFIYHLLDPSLAGTSKGLISTVVGDTPFYTNHSFGNPVNVSLTKDETKQIVFWVNATGSANETNYTFFVYANVTSDMSIGNISDEWNVTIVEAPAVGDTIYPNFSSPTETPTDSPTFSIGSNYEFNITVENHNGTGGIEFNGTNYTLKNDTLYVYNWTTSNLPAGTFNYYWWSFGNGSDNNPNESEAYTYTINQAVSNVNLTLNNLQSNLTINHSNLVNISCDRLTGDLGATIETYYDNNKYNSGIQSISNNTNITDTGIKNVTCIYLDSQNYSTNFTTHWLNLTTPPGVDTEYPIFNDTEEFPVDPTTWASGKTYHFNMTINNTNSTGGIEFNNTNYSVKNATATKYNFTINDIPAGVYTYNWWAYGNGSDNLFNFSEDYTYTINQLNSSVNLTLNNQNQNITINVSNTVNLTCEIYSGQGSMNLYNNSIQINDGLTTETLSNVSNYSTAGIYNVTCIALESQNYSQNYSTFWVNVTTPQVDTEYPEFSSPVETPINGTIYQPSVTYEFNISVDNHNSTGGIDFNGTNYSRLNATATIYNFTIDDLGAGTYYYYWWSFGNGTDNNPNESESYTYTINQNVSSVNLTLNDIQGNLTINESNNVNLSCGELIGESGSLVLYNDTFVMNTGTNSISNSTNITDAGVYNITCIYENTQNYSTNYTTHWLNVTTPTGDTTPPYFDEDLTNQSLEYKINLEYDINASDETGFGYFNVNDTRFTINSSGVLVNNTILGVLEYYINISINDTTGNDNSTILLVNITQATPTAQVWLNGTNGNISIINNSAIWLNGTLLSDDNSTVNCYLFNNESRINIGNPPLENLTTFDTNIGDYNITVYCNETQNYTSAFEIYWLNVTTTYVAPSTIDLLVITPADLTALYNVTQGRFFNITVNVTCRGNDCGEVNVTFDPYQNQSDGFSPTTIAGLSSGNGLTSKADGLWIMGTIDDFIYHTSFTGVNQSDGFSVSASGGGDGTGLTTNGTDFWIVDNIDDFVYHFNSSGQNQSDGFDILGDGSGSALGISTNGSSLYVIDDDEENIYEFDYAGSILRIFDLETTYGIVTPNAITSDGGDFWIIDTNTNFVYHINSTLQNQTDGFDINQFGIADGKGMTLYDDEFWILDQTDGFIYHLLDPSLSETSKGLISTIVGDTPFYTNHSLGNPVNVSLTKDETKQIVFWVNATGAGNATNYTFFVYANVTSDESISNISDEWNVTIDSAVIADTLYPNFSSPTETPTDSPTYQPGITYEFNITVENHNGTGGIEFNHTNYTVYNDTLVIYNFTIGGLPAGVYPYYWWSFGNGTDNNPNESESYTYTINQNVSSVNLTLNDIQGNLTINESNNVNLSCGELIGESGSLVLYNDTFVMNTGTNSISNSTNITDAGVYNITCIYENTQNYSTNYTTHWLNVTTPTDTTPPSVTSLTETPADPATYSPNQEYGFNSTVTDASSILNVTLEFNNTNYTAGSSGSVYNVTILDLPAGSYTYRWYANDSEGNLNFTETGTYTINQATPNVYTFINGSASNLTIENNTAIWLNGTTDSNDNSSTICILYNNDSRLNFGTVPIQNLTTFNTILAPFNITTICNATQNYTSNYSIFWVNVTITSIADTIYPNFSSPTETPADPHIYQPGITYEFNITVENHNGTGGIEFNYTNYTVYNDTLVIYNFTISDLSAGVYPYYWWSFGNGTDNNPNESESYTYTINQNTSSVNLTLNGNQANVTINQSNVVNITCEELIGEGGNLIVYNASAIINHGTGTLTNQTNFTDVGVYNVTCIYENTQNYSSNYDTTHWVNVTGVDTSPPTWDNPRNFTQQANISFSESMNASDGSGISWYWLNDTNYFNISQEGQITNVTNLSLVTTYWLIATVNDTGGYQSNLTFFINITALAGPAPATTCGSITDTSLRRTTEYKPYVKLCYGIDFGGTAVILDET